jgi:DNA/RNA endonuclease YhcR with UshA esterase domain
MRRLIYGAGVLWVAVLIAIGAAASSWGHTIYEVQYNDTLRGDYPDCYPSPFESQTVTVTGVVTAITEALDFDNFFIQDSSGWTDTSWTWSGIYVFDNSIHPSLGDQITLTGLITEYYGLTEIDPSDHEIIATDVELPDPVLLTCADITGGCSVWGEQYEGMLVQLENVVVMSEANEYGEWYVSDDGGLTLTQVDDDCFQYRPQVGDTIYFLTGVVKYSHDTFELHPRSIGDIVTTLSGTGEARIGPRIVSLGEQTRIRVDITASIYSLYTVELELPPRWNWSKDIGSTRYLGLGPHSPELPPRWNWSKDIGNIELVGDRFADGMIEVRGEGTDSLPYVISVSSADTSLLDEEEVGRIYVDGLTAPQEAGVDIFVVRTAVEGDEPEEIYGSPTLTVMEFPATMDLRDVQAPGEDGYTSKMLDSTVTVRGTVVGPSKLFNPSSGTSFWIVDSTGGVNVYSYEDASNVSWKLGMDIIITDGVVDEYNGLTEVAYSDPNQILVVCDTVITDTMAVWSFVNLAMSQGISEVIEGSLVRVTGAKVATTPVQQGAGKNFQAWNGRTLIDVRVNDACNIDLSQVKEGNHFTIVGIGGQYDDEPPYNSGYQLMPRFQLDLSLDTLAVPPSAGPEIIASPNPFSPDLGEVMVIVVNGPLDHSLTVRIYDLEGRLVRTYDNLPGGANSIEWPGTDETERQVGPGIYLCHLEAVGPDGKGESQVKPLVVGTPLE